MGCLAQAKAARSKVEEYELSAYDFSLDQRQCATFVLDVMRAAEVPVPETGASPLPRALYDAIGDGACDPPAGSLVPPGDVVIE